MRRKHFISTRVLPALFVLFITIPFINEYFHLFPSVKNTENRKLAIKPTFDINLLDPYPEAYDNYYNDHFSLRNNYNRYFNYWKYKYFKINPLPHKVVIGKDGWLFFNATMLPSRRKSRLLSLTDLDSIKLELNRRNEFLKEHNCSLYIGVIPAKPSIYTEKINAPYYLPEHDSIKTIGEQFIHYMDSASQLNIIDIKPSLLAQKASDQIYQKLDHHCNHLGGFYIAETVLQKIHEDYPSVSKGNMITDYQLLEKYKKGGNLSKLLGLQDFLHETKPYFHLKDTSKTLRKGEKMNYKAPEGFKYVNEFEQRRTTQNKALPNCMIIRDSYGNYYRDFISYGFNNTLFIWDKWEYKLNKEIFLKEKPDIMIILILESQLEKLKGIQQ